MRLLVISHTPHYKMGNQVLAWGPTVRELDHIARLFGELAHLAPLVPGPAPASAQPYADARVTLIPIRPAGGEGLGGKIDALAASPSYSARIALALRTTDVVHVRCPCNVGLVACVVLSLLRTKPRWAKYAGNWRPRGPEPLSYRLQRFWLESGLFGGPVTVNGRWQGQPAHVHSFLNPCFEKAELDGAREATAAKTLRLPVRLLFAGVLREEKGILRAVRAVAELHRRRLAVRLDVVGDGPAKEKARAMASELGVEPLVTFHGWQPRSRLGRFYRRAHFVILPSCSEGWPKVLSEGMAYRAVPIAHGVSSIEQVLTETGAGIPLRTLEPSAYADAIEALVSDPEEWKTLADRGQLAAERFTYEVYVERLAQLLRQAYPSIPVADMPPPRRRRT